ncbi:hypothetical protein [Clostridium sardiniense]|uniref:tetratricopeptide repeat protein n=1 Tax=Clostridium sardiniense TaxID=29369 RepID=UPI003D32B378
MIKNFKKLSVVLVITTLFSLSLISCTNSKVNKYIEAGKSSLNSKQYDQAKTDFENALKEDKDNKEASDLLNIIENYESAKKSYESKNYKEAEEYLSKIGPDYSNYKIKEDIDKLKEDITLKEEAINKISDQINSVDKLINDKKFTDAENEIKSIKLDDADNDQKKKIDDQINKINKEKEKVEADKKAKEKASIESKSNDNTSKNTTSHKEASSKKSSANNSTSKSNSNTKKESASNEGVTYTNKKFGFTFKIPSSWIGHYSIKQTSTGVSVIFKAADGTPGLLIAITSNLVDGEYLDNTTFKTINGTKYVLGLPSDIGLDPDNSSYKLYKELEKDYKVVVDSFKGI